MTLLEYIYNNFSKPQFKKHGLINFCKKQKNKINLNEKEEEEIFYNHLTQKCFNEACKNEINKVAYCLNNENIKIAFFKGLILAEDVYEKPEMRMFSDIDILVNPSDLTKAVKICKLLGYSNEFTENDDEIQKGIDIINNWNKHHFDPMTKIVKQGIFEFPVTIELHTYTYNPYLNHVKVPYTQITGSVLNNSVLHERDGYKNVYKLNVYDNLMCLIMHNIKHFFADILNTIRGSEPVNYYNVQQLLDIDLYIRKNNIDLKTLIEKAREWDVVPEVVLILNIIKTYDKNITANFNLNEYYEKYRRNEGFTANSIDLLLKNNDLFEFMLLSSWEQAKHIVDNLKIRRPSLLCYKGESFENLSEMSPNVFNKRYNNINIHFKLDDIFNSYVNSNYYRCKMYAKWSEKHFTFLFKIKTSEIHFDISQINDEGEKVNGVGLYFVDYNAKMNSPFLKQLCIQLFYTGEIPKLLLTEYEPISQKLIELDNSLYSYKFGSINDEYTIELKIMFEVLNSFVFNNRILFDVNIADYGDISPNYRDIFAWASVMKFGDYHDITSYGCLDLINTPENDINMHSQIELLDVDAA